MSVTPTATSSTTITASDENSRNSSISTTFNAHSHLDISDMSGVNTYRIGDGTAGNKTYSVNDDQASDPALRFDTTSDYWTLTNDGSTFSPLTIVSGAVILGENTFRIGDNTDNNDKEILFNEGTTDGKIQWDISENLFKVSHDGGSTFLYNVHSVDATALASGSVLIAAGNGALQYAGTLQNGQALVGNSSGPPTPQFVNRFALGSFTRDTSTATGTQAVTGVGFKPKAAVFLAAQGGSDEASWGVDIGTARGSIFTDDAIAADTIQQGTNSSITDRELGNTDLYAGTVSTFDVDGFTISWTKTGTPTGTLTVIYMVWS